MNTLETLFSQLPFAHHAYGIESATDASEYVCSLIPQEECSYIFNKNYDTFKIADARAIKALQSEKTDRASVFILSFSFINIEAQNALLKVLEEPSSNTYFIIIAPQFKSLLPTFQSRLAVHNFVDQTLVDQKILKLDDFLSLNRKERFDLIKNLSDKKREPVLGKTDVLRILDDAEAYSIHRLKQKEYAQCLEFIFQARKYLGAKGASIKMILDTLAIMLPVEART